MEIHMFSSPDLVSCATCAFFIGLPRVFSIVLQKVLYASSAHRQITCRIAVVKRSSYLPLLRCLSLIDTIHPVSRAREAIKVIKVE